MQARVMGNGAVQVHTEIKGGTIKLQRDLRTKGTHTINATQ